MKDVFGKWIYNKNPDGIWSDSDYFDTKEEAIRYGKEEYADGISDHFYVGVSTDPSIKISVNGGYVIDEVIEAIADECGEYGENFLSSVSSKEEDILSERLTAVFKEWMKEFGYEPSFFIIESTEKIELP